MAEGRIVPEGDCPTVELWSVERIEDALARLQGHAVVAVDMPIALARTGRRSAEEALRTTLGASARSVFTSPTRAAVAAASQAEATERNRANGGPGISAQAFGLFASIRELRAALAAAPQARARWCETHPETAFAVMNDGTPLASKRTGLGVAQRLQLLRVHCPELDTVLLDAPPKVPIDDVLDALAALWSAHRVRQGLARSYGPNERDDEDFPLAVMI